MEFRKSTKEDVKDIMNIIKQAQEHFKSKGINQWQDNYPNEEVINKDIDNDISYVGLKDGKIVATTVISFDGESTYNTIHGGQWLSDYDYAVIHRVAVDNSNKGSGLSHKIIEYVEKLCIEKGIKSIKVDTHTENIPMQGLLKKNGFEYCGVIHLLSGDERVAFEKLLV